ncbi:MAG: hypothetical protein M3N53_05700 [Actinomycetota bacterium]|nr:hypothetical protein [Actinomycetota bacterium]
MTTEERELLVCVTIDVDLISATSSSVASEMPAWRRQLERLRVAIPDFRATVFVRADHQLEQLFGRADHIFVEYEQELRQVASNGHELGWHPHSYSRIDGRWIQNTNEELMVSELEQVAAQLDGFELEACRMGWGFHTNKTMEVVDRLGFSVDSSAIPRPVYRWEDSIKDWTSTPDHPYHPSHRDYRVPGGPAFRILEVPMSVVPVPAPHDTEPGVKRYLNLVYWPEIFKTAVRRWIPHHNHLVTITHAHELLGQQTHPLFSPDQHVLEANLQTLNRIVADAGKQLRYITLSEFAGSASAI